MNGIAAKLRILAVTPFVLLLVSGSAKAVLNIEEIQFVLKDFDSRVAEIAPSAAALADAGTLNAQVRWNRFGTVHTLFNPDGVIQSGLSQDPETAARDWIMAHRDLFGLSVQSAADLHLARDSILEDSSAHVLLFYQQQDGVNMTDVGRIKIGVVDGKLFWVASNAVGSTTSFAGPTLTSIAAWQLAAAYSGLNISVTGATTAIDGEWDTFDVAALPGDQRARLAIFKNAAGATVPVWEVNVLNMTAGAVAYTAWVDATNGDVLKVRNRVQQFDNRHADEMPVLGRGKGEEPPPAINESFSGDYPPGQSSQCGPCHGPFAVGEGYTRIAVTAAAANSANDIFIDVHFDAPNCDNLVAHGDSGTSPEAATYSPDGGIPVGDYYVEVCPFDAGSIDPTFYTGSFSADGNTTVTANPMWLHFPLTPPLDLFDQRHP